MTAPVSIRVEPVSPVGADHLVMCGSGPLLSVNDTRVHSVWIEEGEGGGLTLSQGRTCGVSTPRKTSRPYHKTLVAPWSPGAQHYHRLPGRLFHFQSIQHACCTVKGLSLQTGHWKVLHQLDGGLDVPTYTVDHAVGKGGYIMALGCKKEFKLRVGRESTMFSSGGVPSIPLPPFAPIVSTATDTDTPTHSGAPVSCGGGLHLIRTDTFWGVSEHIRSEEAGTRWGAPVPLPFPTAHPAVVTYAGYLVVIGGRAHENRVHALSTDDPSAEWRDWGTLPLSLDRAVATKLDDDTFFLSGYAEIIGDTGEVEGEERVCYRVTFGEGEGEEDEYFIGERERRRRERVREKEKENELLREIERDRERERERQRAERERARESLGMRKY
ncbi:hypothetical protein KIPB_004520 [Kipferlia bialata]|uniref:Uncharacterized protein n=1 Tax=Kipferlia bialata TaxID=797122 RepID=A0A391NVW4_9EUKA|nr:hypothetical protein KIPB_004520 [Kipferlia bialata]|eukprot:g4520.t1